MTTYIGAGTTDFLIKLVAGIILFHVALAVIHTPWYTYLIQQEWMVCSNFVNAVAQALRVFIGSFLGFF